MKKFMLGLFLVIFVLASFSFVGCAHRHIVIKPNPGHQKHYCRDKRRCLRIIQYHDYHDYFNCDIVKCNICKTKTKKSKKSNKGI